MANFDFTWVKNAGYDFLKDVDDPSVEWSIPFDTIVNLPSGTKGRFGRFLVNKCFTDAGLTVSRRPLEDRGEYDWVINDFRVGVKTSFEGQNGVWFFQQIRYPENYDYLCCIGISPDKVKCFILHSREIEELIKTEELMRQHSGNEWWCYIDVGVNPGWYLGDATLDMAIEIFSKCSTGNYMSHWGQIQEL